jgi:hypothetical protein
MIILIIEKTHIFFNFSRGEVDEQFVSEGGQDGIGEPGREKSATFCLV